MGKLKAQLHKIISNFRGQPLVVCGDLILDEFVWGNVRRISPEAPVPVVEVSRETVQLGGAANVASNLSVLGACPSLIGAVGNDRAGERLLGALAEAEIGRTGVVVVNGRTTSVKTRIIAHHQQVCRTDRESRDPLTDGDLKMLDHALSAGLQSSRGAIFSDYGKGVLASPWVGEWLQACQKAGLPASVDPKRSDFRAYRGATLITPNTKEAEEAAGLEIVNDSALDEVGRILLAQANAKYLLITRGERGMALFDGKKRRDIPTMAREVFDVTGAGDTVIATLTLALASGAGPYEAALLANLAAGVVVGKLGTAPASLEELEAALEKTTLQDSQG